MSELQFKLYITFMRDLLIKAYTKGTAIDESGDHTEGSASLRAEIYTFLNT
jgi:hypothetical protein